MGWIRDLPVLRISPRALFLLPLATYTIPLLWIPFEGDESVYAAVAREMLDGRVPYRDIFDHKPPIIYAWYALSFALFGEFEFAPRLVAGVQLCGATACLFAIARAMFSERRAYLLAALFAVSTGSVLARFNANTEVFALLPATAALALMVSRARRFDARPAFAAGFLIGWAIWTRPLFLPAGVSLGLWLIFEGIQHRQALPALSYTLGCIATVPLVVAPFAAVGALEPFRYAVFEYQRFYFNEYDGYRWIFLITAVPRAVVGLAPLLVAAYFGLSGALRTRRWNEATRVVLVWSAGALVGQFLSGRFYPHYLAVMLPSLVLCAGFLPEDRRWRLSLRAPLAWVLGASLLVGLVGNLWEFRALTDASHPEQQASAVARAIAGETCSGELIWEYGRLVVPYFRADRGAPTRFIYDRPFWLDPDTLDEALVQVRATPPVLIVDSLQMRQPYPDQGIDTEMGGLYYPSRVARLLEEKYVFERPIPEMATGATLYRLRGTSAASSDRPCSPLGNQN